MHISYNEEEIVVCDNESDVSKLTDNEEVEYDSVLETSLDANFDEEDDKFQAPLIP